MDAMEAAHHEGNDQKLDFLAPIRNVVLLAHKSGKNKSPLKKSITLVWWLPDWLPMTCFDQLEEIDLHELYSWPKSQITRAMQMTQSTTVNAWHLSPWPDQAAQSIRLCLWTWLKTLSML